MGNWVQQRYDRTGLPPREPTYNNTSAMDKLATLPDGLLVRALSAWAEVEELTLDLAAARERFAVLVTEHPEISYTMVGHICGVEDKFQANRVGGAWKIRGGKILAGRHTEEDPEVRPTYETRDTDLYPAVRDHIELA